MSITALLIEDNDINRRFMRDLIETGGHTTYEVLSEENVFPVLENAKINLIISDYLLDKGTAEETLRKIRLVYPQLPIWILSGVEREKVAPLCVDIHARFIPKPLEVAHFLKLLNDEDILCQHAS